MDTQTTEKQTGWSKPIVSNRVLHYTAMLINTGKIYLYPQLEEFILDFEKYRKEELQGRVTIFPIDIYQFLGYNNHYIHTLRDFYNLTHPNTQQTFF